MLISQRAQNIHGYIALIRHAGFARCQLHIYTVETLSKLKKQRVFLSMPLPDQLIQDGSTISTLDGGMQKILHHSMASHVDCTKLGELIDHR
jgi:hypothetical protein